MSKVFETFGSESDDRRLVSLPRLTETNEVASSGDAKNGEPQMAALELAQVTELCVDERPRAPWFGVVGLEMPRGVSVHPTIKSSVVRYVAEGFSAFPVDRFDGHFGYCWGFDSPDETEAHWHVIAVARQTMGIVGAIAVVESTLFWNQRLADEPVAEVTRLKFGG